MIVLPLTTFCRTCCLPVVTLRSSGRGLLSVPETWMKTQLKGTKHLEVLSFILAHPSATSTISGFNVVAD